MYSIAVHYLPPLPGPFLSLNQIHRLYGVALSTLRRKLKAGVLVRVDGKGVTEASVRKLYGAPPDHPAEGESAAPERGESEGGSIPGATGGALPPTSRRKLRRFGRNATRSRTPWSMNAPTV